MLALDERLYRILPEVAKPARYTNNELNAYHKDWNKIAVKTALAFPDLYEIGMGNLGLKILYHQVNQRDDALAERVYMPWTDMQQKMKEYDIVLTALESGRDLRDFDLIGFTLQYELSYTNIIKMLDLAKIPRFSKDRAEQEPWIIAGGPCAFNPEPIADFFDFLVLGDGEQIIHEIIMVIKEGKELNLSKADILRKLADIPGIYIPAFYHIEYKQTGEIESVRPAVNFASAKIIKRVVSDLDKVGYPDKMVVPFLEIVHDRIMVEVMRGCTRGCRFCQAGMIYRPVRERSLDTLKQQVEQLIAATGYGEVSLASLSTSDYTCIERLVGELMAQYQDTQVALSLPSLRVDSFSVNLAQEIQKTRKTGLTFAPEAGTERLRNVINKNVTEADLYAAVKGAFTAGWLLIKLYFMIGLPTETKTDLDGIVDLAVNVLQIGRDCVPKGSKRPQVNVSVSSFVPKSHTPFQWEAQNRQDDLLEKQAYLRAQSQGTGIRFQFHDVRSSYLEAVFAKGDRRLSQVLAKAVDYGCQFDSWSECFNYSAWMQAFTETGIDGSFYAHRDIDGHELLPWDHLGSGIEKDFLLKERAKAAKGITTKDCRFNKCNACGICSNLPVTNLLQKGDCDGQ